VTVSSTTNKQSYNGNGSQSVFAYTFKIFAEADVEVYVGTTLKTLSTHYTLSGVGAAGGGNVTFTTGNIPAAGTGNVTILRSLALTQGVDLINYGKFDAEVIESQYDKLVMMVQQLQEQADRTIRFNTTVSDAGGVEITDTVAERSGKVLAYDANGDLSVANELGDWQGNWTSSRAYAVRDLALDAATNNVYTCLISHTSGTLSSDVSANKWALVINASAVAASATTATTKASEAAASATTATNQASTATTKASEAATSASTATTKANTATTQASTATTKASEASTSASNAATSASTASTQATNSSNSASAGSTSATNSANSATAAASSASTATTKANSATASASTASTQATNSSNSATASANSATASANSATASGNSATAAASSASTATTKRNESSASATAAANSAAAAATALDSFDDRYLGAKSSAPGQDNDGNALAQGALYFDTTANGMKVYDGSAWIAASSSGTASLLTYKYVATNNQTTFTGNDVNSVALSYTTTNIIVLLNGITLDASDYTASNGSSIILGTGADTGDELVVVAFKSFTVADHYTKSQANTLLAAKATNTAVALKAPLANPSFTGGTSNASNLSTSFSTAAIKVQPKTTSGWSLVTGSGPSDIPYLQTTAGGAAAGAMTINPYGGNVGVGTVSPLSKLDVSGGFLTVSKDANTAGRIGASEYITGSTANDLIVQATGSGVTRFYQSGTHSMTIANAGDVVIGNAYSSTGANGPFSRFTGNGGISQFGVGVTNNVQQIQFFNGNGGVGGIWTNGSSTSYNTSSDYRLKTDVQPMTGATATFKLLKPVNFEWIVDGTRTDGFLAHELQEVIPEAATGSKDAMRDEEYEVTPAVLNDEGNETTAAVMGTRSVPDIQGIDQSKLVPLLTATIQELITRIEALENV